MGPLPETVAGDMRVWDLRNCRQVIIPEGTKRIGNHWFYGSSIESVEVPASVKCINAYAFGSCESLKRVTFAEGSKLESTGVACFCGSDIEEIELPNALRKIGHGTFHECENLRTIYVRSDCEASLADAWVPNSTSVIPCSTTLTGGANI